MNQKPMTVDGVSLPDVAEAFGTPVFVYSAQQIRQRVKLLKETFAPLEHHISFAMKANSNIHLLALLREQGIGVDAVSFGEIRAAERAGFKPREISFNGNGKTVDELDYALKTGIGAINVDSLEEWQTLESLAAEFDFPPMRLFLRLNPDIDAKTHPYIATGLRSNKFGMDFETGHQIVRGSEKNKKLEVVGIHMHIGSQLLDAEPYEAAIRRMKSFMDAYDPERLPWLNIGGGWGIDYQKKNTPFPIDWYRANIIPQLKALNRKIAIEPGRFIMGEAGLLMGRVLLVKRNHDKHFTVTDIGMNDLARPSLYVAYHHIEPVIPKPSAASFVSDIVGPICESGDRIAENYSMSRLEAGDLLVVHDVGAYGYAMTSNYNLRPRPAEVLLEDGKMILIRPRENIDDLINY